MKNKNNTKQHIWDYLLDKVQTEVVQKYNLSCNLMHDGEVEDYFKNNKSYLLDTLSSEEFYSLVLFMKVTDDVNKGLLEY